MLPALLRGTLKVRDKKGKLFTTAGYCWEEGSNRGAVVQVGAGMWIGLEEKKCVREQRGSESGRGRKGRDTECV
jgi:hypothetical protein